MRVISKKKINEFCEKNSVARSAMDAWYKLALQNEATDFNELKETFGKADYVAGKYTIFDVGGNKYRLVAVIHYNTGRLYIRHVFTHAEYDKWSKENRGK